MAVPAPESSAVSDMHFISVMVVLVTLVFCYDEAERRKKKLSTEKVAQDLWRPRQFLLRWNWYEKFRGLKKARAERMCVILAQEMYVTFWARQWSIFHSWHK